MTLKTYKGPVSLVSGSLPTPELLNTGLPTTSTGLDNKVKAGLHLTKSGIGKALNSPLGAAGIGFAGSIGQSLLSGGKSSGVGNVLSGLGDIASSIPGGQLYGTALKAASGLANMAFGSKINEENVAKVESNTEAMRNFTSNASDFDTLASNWQEAATGMNFDRKFIGSDGWFSNKAKNTANRLRAEQDVAEEWVQNSLDYNADLINDTRLENLEANYAAFGGTLDTQGGMFSNGLIYVDNGGTHEENPNEGVQMGVDPEGVPNLVEEGEVIFHDYVFSNRLKVDKKLREKHKLKEDITYADAALKLSREAEERPNDPISNRGMEALLSELAYSQEELKAKREERRYKANIRAYGGAVNKFATGGNWEYNNNKNDETVASSSMFAPFYNNGTFNFGAMYADGSTYRQAVDNIARALYKRRNDASYRYTPEEEALLAGYNTNIGKWNDGKNYQSIYDMSYDNIIGNSLNTTDGSTFTFNPAAIKGAKGNGLAFDYLRGGHHWGAVGATPAPVPPSSKTTTVPSVEQTVPETPAKKAARIFVEQNYGKQDWGEGFTLEDYNKNPVNRNLYDSRVDADGNEYLTLRNITGNYPDYDNWMRYVPAIGAAVGFGSTLMGKPDFSDAESVLAASSRKGTYMPIRYRPNGNYLTYRPVDRNAALNAINAQSAATRRNIMNTSAQNRGNATAALLAADYNAVNAAGNAIMQQELANREQQKIVEDFNRATNVQNSSGFLQADQANQNALANLRNFQMNGVLQAAQMRQNAKLARENALSVNLTNLFNSIGDIGREKVDRKWRTWMAQNGMYAPTQNAFGGKLKKVKKRGLTI